MRTTYDSTTRSSAELGGVRGRSIWRRKAWLPPMKIAPLFWQKELIRRLSQLYSDSLPTF